MAGGCLKVNSKKRFTPPAVGGSSLLVIFAVLCLTVFALLALSTVQANSRVSDSAANNIIAYYNADTKAEKILANLRLNKQVDNVKWQGDLAYYKVDISDTQVLDVCVRIKANEYDILRWKIVPAQEWQSDNTLPVWTGD